MKSSYRCFFHSHLLFETLQKSRTVCKCRSSENNFSRITLNSFTALTYSVRNYIVVIRIYVLPNDVSLLLMLDFITRGVLNIALDKCIWGFRVVKQQVSCTQDLKKVILGLLETFAKFHELSHPQVDSRSWRFELQEKVSVLGIRQMIIRLSLTRSQHEFLACCLKASRRTSPVLFVSRWFVETCYGVSMYSAHT